MWFDRWSDVLRVLLVGPAAYAVLMVVLRTSGKRTLAKLNAFDLVVTVSLGSTLATIFLSGTVSWSEGAVALAVLALLQWLVAACTARWPRSRAVVTAGPTLLLRDGTMLHDALRSQRLTESEVRQAVRGTGAGDVSAVAAVVLETDGTLSVVPRSKVG
ncbi:DUF421 domain-containing protein, partial [uncultured Nocardioides sp.]|uniref:DUF421 domain-containing protein n=1 Tax=uncultured Nocardioides sp. TaxID=198441 RepID=UPI0025EE54D0